jgi:hypothetical protein
MLKIIEVSHQCDHFLRTFHAQVAMLHKQLKELPFAGH